MNELILLSQIILIVVFTFIALKIGKSALITLISLQAVIANLFVLKQIDIFGLNATCADAFVVGSVLGINLLQEYCGQDMAKKTINIGFFALVFFLIVSFIHLLFIPNGYDWAHNLFNGILKFAPRISVASFIAYIVSLKFNTFIYAYLEKKLKSKFFLFRNLVSITLSQALDTALFVFLGLYGLVGNVLQVMLVGFVLKLIVIFLSTPLITLAKNFFKFNLDK